MSGWGSYTPLDGCFQRVRFTGETAQVPLGFRVFENGVLIRFAEPVNPEIAGNARSHLAQAWNYRYSPGYGSQELSPSHPSVAGHDSWPIKASHVVVAQEIFLEIPDLQPVNQLHLRLNPNGSPLDLFATVHKLAPPFTEFDGDTASTKIIAAHPILADMLALTVKPVPNPWSSPIAGARSIRLEAGKNLTFSMKTIQVKANEPIKLTFVNPDVVPHNWALIRPGTLAKVGDLANKIIAEPDAVARRYIPRTDDILAHTDIAEPQGQSVIFFRSPAQPGRYPYLCTFPGHWMVMNGELIVE
jgi:azurin